MSALDQEEKTYQDDVKAVKKWWTDSRWRYTKRPFTAEQIVAKRGNLIIDYPSNVQSKKLWQLMEQCFKVFPPVTVYQSFHSDYDRMVTLASRTVV